VQNAGPKPGGGLERLTLHGDKIKASDVQQVGRYQIVGELGRGAMGVVYKALDPAIGRTIAIKSIRLADLTDEAERQRLRDRLFREAQSAGMLSHPNIVTIYDIAEEGEMAYIFMEFVNGPPLSKLLASAQPLDKEALLSIVRQTAAALDYAHKNGIVHRDIKPANIMIDGNGTAKVTDFGVAKILSQSMTLTGTLMGTPSYMSPEQIESQAVIDGRADQYSLGVVVYEALTGEKPFVADYLPALLYKIVREDFVAPQRLNPSLGPRVEAVLRRAMSKNAADRYNNCAEFAGALSASLRATPGWTPMPLGASQNLPTSGSLQARDAGETVAVTTGPMHSPFRKPSRVLRNTLLMAAAVAVICAGAYFEFRPAISETRIPQAQDVQQPPPRVPTPPPRLQPPKSPEPEVARTETRVREISPSAPSVPQNGEFELTATPAGSIAVFDNDPDLRCVTPCTMTLPAGRHTFVVDSDGYREEHRIIEVPHDPGLIVNLEKVSGMLSVTSKPAGLSVMIDGWRQWRRTPSVFAVTPGRHRVEVVNGSEKKESIVEVPDGATFNLNVDWTK